MRPYLSSEILPVFMLIIPHIPNLEIKQNREATFAPLAICDFVKLDGSYGFSLCAVEIFLSDGVLARDKLILNHGKRGV